MIHPSAVLRAGLAAIAILSASVSSAQTVSGIEVSVRARSPDEGRSTALRNAAEEAARRLGLDAATAVPTSSVVREERFEDGRLSLLVDVTLQGARPAGEARSAGETGGTVSGPAWILVVHAVRGPGGKLVPWDRDDPWGAAWRVPTTLKGLRVVPVTGDAEDSAIATGAALDAFDGRAFRHLASKYRASNIALVVREGSEAAVAAWRNGFTTDWSRMPIGDLSDPAAVRLQVSRSLAALVRTVAQPAPVADASSDRPERGDTIRISDWRRGAQGAEYRAVLRSADGADLIDRLSSEGIDVLSAQEGPDGTEVVLGTPDGYGIEPALRRAGIRVGR